MTSVVIYKGDLRTELIHLKSDQLVENDAPTDNNGKGQRFSPTDIVATSLASCMLTVMGIKAQSMNQETLMLGAKADVKKTMASEPRRISKIEVNITMAKKASDKEKSILENTAKTCPVAKSLHPDIEQVLQFKWV